MSSRHLADPIRRRFPQSDVRFVDTVCQPTKELHDVQTDADVRREFDAAKVVGLTAGTSTPDDVIDRVEARIRLRADASAGRVRQAGAPAARTLRGGVEVEARTRSVAGVAEGLR